MKILFLALIFVVSIARAENRLVPCLDVFSGSSPDVIDILVKIRSVVILPEDAKTPLLRFVEIGRYRNSGGATGIALDASGYYVYCRKTDTPIDLKNKDIKIILSIKAEK